MNCSQCGKPLQADFLFCPYCGVRQNATNPFDAPKGKDDPWAVGGRAYGGPAEASVPKKGGKKNKTVFLVMTAIVAVLVVLGAVVGLATGGSGYDPVLESYFTYAESDSPGAIEALWHPGVLQSAIEDYGRGTALSHLDEMSPCWGTEIVSWRKTDDTNYFAYLPEFNETYGANATQMTEVWVVVSYPNDSDMIYIITLVEEDGVWYLVNIY